MCIPAHGQLILAAGRCYDAQLQLRPGQCTVAFVWVGPFRDDKFLMLTSRRLQTWITLS